MQFNKYHNLLEATADLRSKGYIQSFELQQNDLVCLRTQKKYLCDDMHIIEFHRFAGESTAADSSIVFAIECHDGVRGLIISSYGVYYDDLPLMEFIDKVRIKPRIKDVL